MGEPIGIIGGTGPLGTGLALRLAAAGLKVQVGSRDSARAGEVAGRLNSRLDGTGAEVSGGPNHEVAALALVVVALPYEAVRTTIPGLAGELAGKVVVSTAVPMSFASRGPEPLHPEAGSAAEELAELCPESRVVGAFQTVAAGQLLDLGLLLDEDVLVGGDDREARREVAELVQRIAGLRAVESGPLTTCRYAEGLTPLLLRLNRLHHAQTGIRITGLQRG
ncbi:MAG: NADPH-dependent F420 reductase [Candidatus Dormibacteraeota bacterium]|nr:NADPH-dependent F420 reductase [Candidatus Dormibacteraeota bacterium]